MSRKNDKQIIYEYLTVIPKGKVVTYGQIAEFLGNKALARSVGNLIYWRNIIKVEYGFKITNVMSAANYQ